MNSTDSKPRSRTEREEEEKARRRAENATIVAGLKQALDGDEQLLGFARGRLAGGIRGKLSLGPEAFFAPFVNIGLTERRVIIQHINAETGRPGEILPHYYALGDIATLSFSDIETFGGEVAARLTMRLRNDQHTRLRLRGQSNLENAQAILKVFQSLTLSPRAGTTPTQRVCATCQHILDQPFKFCPYCGQAQDLNAPVSTSPAPAPEPERTYPPTPPGPTPPEFLDTVPYQDAEAYRGPTVDDGLDFLTSDPTPAPAVVPKPAPAPEASPSPEPETAAAPVAEPEAVASPEATTSVSEEAGTFETPSTFEGWSVDPGASAAVVAPDFEAEAPALTAEAEPVSTPSFVPGHVVETEATVVEPIQETTLAHPDPAESDFSQTHVSSVPEAGTPTVHPEAEFSAIPTPDPLAFASEEPGPVPFAAAHADSAPVASVSEETPPAVTFEAPQAESDPSLSPTPLPEGEASGIANPDFLWTPTALETAADIAPLPVTEADSPAPTEFDAPPATESFAPPATPSPEAEPVAAAPAHDSAGFVTEPVPQETPTPVSQEFEPFAPVNAAPAAPEPAPTPVAAPILEPVSALDPVPPGVAATVPPVAPPDLPAPAAEASVPASEDRFAALLKEIRGGDAPAASPVEEPAGKERRDGPMSVKVHIMRPPISVNETFTGRNADEVVGKLKQRVLPELNFALRLMVNQFSNLRFAQEIVRRYNDQEKTNYPLPNSCWEFLLNAEEINYVTIQLTS